ncbi:Crp/Fnr family transcriptional regulator [Litorivivens sp.]|uniref:Crp/Fnr family transcriptional regulator n=1 Tax=Litorivivens sp. TaxID=2020868 RepID=UPI0035634DAB
MQTQPLPQQNHLLAALPSVVVRRLKPHLGLVCFSAGQMLHESDDLVDMVYFPVDSIVSLLHVMEDGSSAEIALVGNDGVIGLSRIMGGQPSTSQAMVISAGQFYQLSGKQFEKEFNRHTELMAIVLRYTQAVFIQMAQTAACNRHHSILQQLCRWLLLSLDRVSGDELVMTQELIAGMLGVRREGVTDAAGKLRNLGVIDYHRGHIKLLDRPQLELLCCECYRVVKKKADSLLPPPTT